MTQLFCCGETLEQREGCDKQIEWGKRAIKAAICWLTKNKLLKSCFCLLAIWHWNGSKSSTSKD